MSIFRFRDNPILALLAAILLFYFTKPYFVWEIADNNYVNFMASALLAFCFYLNCKIKVDNIHYFVFLLGLLLFYAYKSEANFTGVVSLCLVAFTPFANNAFYSKTFDFFTTIYAVITTISIIVLILSLLGIISPISTIEAPDETNAIGYYSIYPLLVTQPLIFRFYGVFDEPGVIGTLSAILLICKRLDLRDWRSVVIMIAGIISMSMFFYLIIFAYLAIKLFVENSGGKFGVVLVFLFFAIFYLATSNNEIMKETLWSRFAWDSETGFFEGENRMHGKDIMYDEIKGTSEFWFGVKNRELYLLSVEGSSSYKNVIALNGVIFFSLYILFYFLIGLKYKPNWFSFLSYCLVVSTTIYQRPNTFSFVWLFLFLCVVKNSQEQNKGNELKRNGSDSKVVI